MASEDIKADFDSFRSPGVLYRLFPRLTRFTPQGFIKRMETSTASLADDGPVEIE